MALKSPSFPNHESGDRNLRSTSSTKPLILRPATPWMDFRYISRLPTGSVVGSLFFFFLTKSRFADRLASRGLG